MKYAILISVLLLMLSVSTRAGLINGDFETGDLTGWTTFNTPNGGTALSDVVLFDTAGTGTPSYSYQMRVGEVSGTIGTGGVGEGAGIEQSVFLNAGTLNISVDIATTTTSLNADGGTFELLLNGTVVDSYSFGAIDVPVERSTLNFSGIVPSGMFVIGAVDARRGFGIGSPDTPIQYIDNVDLTGTSVPEPSTVALALTRNCQLPRPPPSRER